MKIPPHRFVIWTADKYQVKFSGFRPFRQLPPPILECLFNLSESKSFIHFSETMSHFKVYWKFVFLVLFFLVDIFSGVLASVQITLYYSPICIQTTHISLSVQKEATLTKDSASLFNIQAHTRISKYLVLVLIYTLYISIASEWKRFLTPDYLVCSYFSDHFQSSSTHSSNLLQENHCLLSLPKTPIQGFWFSQLHFFLF